MDFFGTIGYFMASGIPQEFFNTGYGDSLIVNESAQTAYPGNVICGIEPPVAFPGGFNQTFVLVNPQGSWMHIQ
jgi:hypothetical protein